MNSPKVAQERRKAVKRAKKNGVPKEEAYRHVQDNASPRFEGHMLEATIDHVYDD